MCCQRLFNLRSSCSLEDYEIKGLKTIQLLKLPPRQFQKILKTSTKGDSKMF